VCGGDGNSEIVYSLDLTVMQLIKQSQPSITAAVMKVGKKYEKLITENIIKILINLKTCHLRCRANFILKL
jgi:hypothetical protein